MRILLIACFFLCAAYSYSNIKDDRRQDAPKWLPLSPEAQEKIIKDYVAALDEFAQVMPAFGGDTESDWAADTVHTMAMAIEQNQYPFLQNYATISQMQNYTAYGMVYFNAIIATYKEPDIAGYALQMLSQSDSLYCELQKMGFEDVGCLSVFNIGSLLNMHLFYTLNGVNNDREVDRELGLLMYSMNVLDSISSLKKYSDKDVYKVAAVLESYAFFQMVCPLIMSFSVTMEKFDAHIDELTEPARFFDSQSAPLFQSVKDGRKVAVMNDAVFEDWMISATNYKVGLLKLLSKFVREWSELNEE